MRIIPLAIEKMVDPAFAGKVRERLVKEMFVNMKLAVVALDGAMALYFAMLVIDSGLGRHMKWVSFETALLVCSTTFNFTAEWLIKKDRLRVAFANVSGVILTTGLGIGFVYQVPEMQNTKMQLAAFSLVVGVVGSAAFTYACNRASFLAFAVPWLLPMVIHLILVDGSLPAVILGSMAIPYVGLLTFLCWRDYERRIELIEAELVTAREKAEVASALDMVNRLKTQQDGDYFLTSLLLQPLGTNAVDEDQNVGVQFLTRQKKNFEFRNQQKYIGGDMSIAHTINFTTGSATVALNADAMGKSIQGAGGCLVFGAVFQSIVDRTRHQEPMQPELWLRQTVTELQRVFESFDCTMLVSVFIVLLENRSGRLLYVNAEHPWGVLYRNGKAQFLESRSYFRKLGTPGFQADLIVDSMQLQYGDVIILGSDGRDDVELVSSKTAQRQINHDEKLFLQHVESGAGKINDIYDRIAASGEITDDFSLVRIEYSKPGASQTESMFARARELLLQAKLQLDADDRPAASRNLVQAMALPEISANVLLAGVKLALKLKDYRLADNCALRLIEIRRDDPQVLFLAALARYRLGDVDRALQMLQSAAATNTPLDLMNQNLQAEIYISCGKSQLAGEAVNAVLEREPRNATARRLLQRIDARLS